MSENEIAEAARAAYDNFSRGDREAQEELLADDFVFSSPDDPQLDRDGYFERCWPNRDYHKSLEVDRVVVDRNQAFVHYVIERTSGGRFHNLELLTIEGGRLKRAEVYYGADIV